MVELRHPGWSSGPVAEASGFGRRLRGIHGAPPGCGVLLPVRSVHGFGLAAPLVVAALDVDLRVLSVGNLAPRRIVTVAACRRMLELPAGRAPPEVGRLLMVSTLGWWPER